MASDPDVLMVFGTIMIAMSSTMALMSVNLNQSATQSFEMATLSCQTGYEVAELNLSDQNISQEYNLTERCQDGLETGLEAKKWASWANDFSMLWLIVGFLILFKAATDYHKDGRLASNIHFS